MAIMLRVLLTGVILMGFARASSAENMNLKENAAPLYTHIFSGVLEQSPLLVDSLAEMKERKFYWEFIDLSVSGVSLRVTDIIRGNMPPRTASSPLDRLFDTPDFWTRASTPLYWQAGRRYLVMLRMPDGKDAAVSVRDDPWEAITVIDLDETVREAAQREALAQYEAKAPARAWQREGGAIFPAAGQEDWDPQIAALKKNVAAGEMTDDDLFRRLGRPVASLKDDEGGGDTLVYAARVARTPGSNRPGETLHHEDGREKKYENYKHVWLSFNRQDGKIVKMDIAYPNYELPYPPEV